MGFAKSRVGLNFLMLAWVFPVDLEREVFSEDSSIWHGRSVLLAAVAAEWWLGHIQQ